MIVPFPKQPVRWWAVREIRSKPGTWRAILNGGAADVPGRTDAGSLWLVLDALKQHGCGLPVIVRRSQMRDAA